MIPFFSQYGIKHLGDAGLWLRMVSDKIQPIHNEGLTIIHSLLLCSSGVSNTLRDIILGVLA